MQKATLQNNNFNNHTSRSAGLTLTEKIYKKDLQKTHFPHTYQLKRYKAKILLISMIISILIKIYRNPPPPLPTMLVLINSENKEIG